MDIIIDKPGCSIEVIFGPSGKMSGCLSAAGLGLQYSSTYEAIEDSRPQRNRLAKLYIEQIPTAEYSVLLSTTQVGGQGERTKMSYVSIDIIAVTTPPKVASSDRPNGGGLKSGFIDLPL